MCRPPGAAFSAFRKLSGPGCEEGKTNPMPAYIGEKLQEIREHAKSLLESTNDPEEERNQHYFWILNAARNIELKLQGIQDMLDSFLEIDEVLEKGGEPVFVVKQVERIVRKHKKG